MSKRRDITNQRFGKLVAKHFVEEIRKNYRSYWRCVCDCGGEINVMLGSLIGERTRSCGCWHGAKHGAARRGIKSHEYDAWTGMIDRCTNKNRNSWPNYGGRGISVCAEWRGDFSAFFSYIGPRPSDKHSLDRIDNDGNYEPGNVRWATAKEQIRNQRVRQKKNWRSASLHAYAVVDSFEDILSSYTGAPYVVCVDSCTAAIHLACAYLKVSEVEIPKLTYVGVPASIKNAGGTVKFREEYWKGIYQLNPYPIFDCARRFTSGMYLPGSFMCLSFHWTKHLQIGRGGAILCDSKEAAEWFQRSAFDGRKRGSSPKGDKGLILGWHYYMTPNLAAQGLMLMSGMQEHNPDLPNSDYPDLSQFKVFQQ